MLTNRKGGLGMGHIGPNLSGLLTPFYPRTFRDESRWTVARLKDWVENPRKFRKITTMQPVALQEGEWTVIRRVFQD